MWEDEDPWQEEEEGGWEYFAGDGEYQEEDKEEIVMDEAVGAEVLNEQEKLFVFLTGERICLPHQLGVTHCTALDGTAPCRQVKVMSRVRFKKRLNIPADLRSHLAEQERARCSPLRAPLCCSVLAGRRRGRDCRRAGGGSTSHPGGTTGYSSGV